MSTPAPREARSVVPKAPRLKLVDSSAPIRADQEWTSLPDAIRKDRQKARVQNRLLAAGLVAACLATGAAGAALGDAGVVTLAIPAFLALKFFEQRRKTTATDDKWIVEQPNNGERLVEMLVEVDGVVLGRDRGIVWFADKAIYFNGQRSWFRIGARHIYPTLQGRVLNRSSDEMAAGKTSFRVVHAPSRVRIKLIESPLGAQTGGSWLALNIDQLGASPTSPVETVLPPLTLDPDYRHDVFRDTELASPDLGRALIAALLSGFLVPWMPLMLIVLAAVVLYGIRIQAYRFIRPARERRQRRANLSSTLRAQSKQIGTPEGVRNAANTSQK